MLQSASNNASGSSGLSASNNASGSSGLFDLRYRTLISFHDYQTPRSIKDACKNLEPQIRVITSLRFLKGYEVSSEAMRKAKDFWLSYKVTDLMDKTPADVSNDSEFLEAAEFLRQEVWKWHVLVFYEDFLSLRFNKQTNDYFMPNKNFPDHFYIDDKNYNRANVNIKENLEIDENFLYYDDYKKLEKDDFLFSKRIKLLPSISFGIKEAKRYWSSKVSREEAEHIYKQFPNEVEKIRTLLWKRHLVLEADRNREKAYMQEEKKKADENLKDIAIKCLVVGSITLLTVGFFFQAPFLQASSITVLITLTALYKFSPNSFAFVQDLSFHKWLSVGY